MATTYEARHEDKVIRYDFEGKRPRDKKEITVSVSADGKEIEIDEELTIATRRLTIRGHNCREPDCCREFSASGSQVSLKMSPAGVGNVHLVASNGRSGRLRGV